MNGQIAVSVKTASNLVDLDDSTIRAAINRQDLAAYRVGRAIRIRVADLEAWIDGLPKVGEEDE